MSFLFGRKNKQTPAGLPPATRDVHTSGGTRSASGPQNPNGVRSKDPTPTPGSNVSNSVGGANTPSPDQGVEQRGASDGDMQVRWDLSGVATPRMLSTRLSCASSSECRPETDMSSTCSTRPVLHSLDHHLQAVSVTHRPTHGHSGD